MTNNKTVVIVVALFALVGVVLIGSRVLSPSDDSSTEVTTTKRQDKTTAKKKTETEATTEMKMASDCTFENEDYAKKGMNEEELSLFHQKFSEYLYSYNQTDSTNISFLDDLSKTEKYCCFTVMDHTDNCLYTIIYFYNKKEFDFDVAPYTAGEYYASIQEEQKKTTASSVGGKYVDLTDQESLKQYLPDGSETAFKKQYESFCKKKQYDPVSSVSVAALKKKNLAIEAYQYVGEEQKTVTVRCSYDTIAKRWGFQLIP